MPVNKPGWNQINDTPHSSSLTKHLHTAPEFSDFTLNPIFDILMPEAHFCITAKYLAFPS